MFSCFALTNKGDRTINEDSVGQCVDSDRGLFIVADGLGGHGAGDVASRYVVEQYLGKYDASAFDSAERYLSGAFSAIHTGLLALQKERHVDMKSTAAAVILTAQKLSLCHIGDTRIYVFAKNKLLYRTLDHSVPQMLVNAGQIREKDIRFHPDRNRLLRALGENCEVVDYDMETLLADTVTGVLICSDGFWEYVNEREMRTALRRAKNAGEWILSMEKTLRKNGRRHERDNYSAIGIMGQFSECI